MSELLTYQESELPPNVIGETTSNLELSIERLFWLPSSSTSKGVLETRGGLAKIIWWGETPEQSKFIKIYPSERGETKPNSRIRYRIQTSLRLFHDYLINCDPIEVQFVTNISNLLIGTASVRPPFGLSNKTVTPTKIAKRIPILGHKNTAIGEVTLNFAMVMCEVRERIAPPAEPFLPDLNLNMELSPKWGTILSPVLSERIATPKCVPFPNQTMRLSIISIYLLPAATVDCPVSSDDAVSFTVECRIVSKLPPGHDKSSSLNVMRFYSDDFDSKEKRIVFNKDDSRSIRYESSTQSTIFLTIWWRKFGSRNTKCLGTAQCQLDGNSFDEDYFKQVKLLEVMSSISGLHVANLICNVYANAKDSNSNIIIDSIPATERLKCGECSGRVYSGDRKSNKSSEKTTPVSKSVHNSTTQTTPRSSVSSTGTYRVNDDGNVDQAVQTESREEDDNCRQLKGLFFARRLRNTKSLSNCRYSLSCDPFWSAGKVLEFTLDEAVLKNFAVTTDQTFLNRVKNNSQTIEIHQKISDSAKLLLGVVRLPLHQFFIAFRDETLASHLSKAKLPVISIDGWSPIVSPETNELRGELETLLAIGTNEQIEYLKSSRSFETLPAVSLPNSNPPLRKTSDLLEVLESALAIARKPNETVPDVTKKVFRILLSVERAVNLPRNPSLKNKKGSKRNKQIKYPPNEEPSAYVTFQADPGSGVMIKSHEGMVYATSIAGKSTNPVWNKRFDVVLPMEYKSDREKRFILKTWKKATTDLAHCRLYPTPLDDSIIGMSAINLSAFNEHKSGFSGWINILDFTGRVNGQLKISVNEIAQELPISNPFAVPKRIRNLDNREDSDFDLGLADVPLNVAIKRKFVELDKISGRLRSRLLGVTGAPESGMDLTDADDAECDEFERDLNTVCDEELDETPVKKRPEFDWVNVFSSINLMGSQSSSSSAGNYESAAELKSEEAQNSEFSRSNSSLDDA